jgi:hypothetical protein
MKNFIFIDVDTDREKPIVFGKPPEMAPPENKEEAAKMILNDISCLAEAIKTLITMASQNGYADRNELAIATVNTIYNSLQDPQSLKENETQDEHKTEA